MERRATAAKRKRRTTCIILGGAGLLTLFGIVFHLTARSDSREAPATVPDPVPPLPDPPPPPAAEPSPTWPVVVAPGVQLPGTIECLRVDGENQEEGSPIRDWDLEIFDPEHARETRVTATARPSAVVSGNRGVRIRGDYLLGKALDRVATGVVTVDYWHRPQPGPSTNSSLGLWDTTGKHSFLNLWKNDQDLWWVAATEVPHPQVARYSGEFTHVVITIDSQSGHFRLKMNDRLVYEGRVNHADRIKGGIGYITTHSGRGGAGTDSYLDELVITSTRFQRGSN